MKFLDRASIRKAVTDAESGFLRAPATLTRTGVFHYAPVGEKPYSVLRLPEEVFSDAAMSSFELVPVVDDHPYSEPDSKITIENARRLQVGSVGTPHRNGDLLDAMICVTDAAMIEKIKNGTVALSCGYFADTINSPGVYNGVPYDRIQRNIRGNHVAICDVARAGERAKLHLDSAVEVEETSSQVENTFTPQEKTNMEKIIVDGLPFEASPILAAAIAKQNKATSDLLAANSAAIADLTKRAEKTQAVCDASAVETASLKAEIVKLKDPSFIAAKITERVAVEKLAASHGLTADGKDLIAVKREVIKKLNPEIVLDGKSNDYVEAFFDAMAVKPAGNPVTEAAAALLAGKPAATPVLDAAGRSEAFNKAIFGADACAVTNRATPTSA